MLKNAKVLRVHNLKNTSTYKTKEFNIYIVLIYNNFIICIRMHMHRII